MARHRPPGVALAPRPHPRHPRRPVSTAHPPTFTTPEAPLSSLSQRDTKFLHRSVPNVLTRSASSLHFSRTDAHRSQAFRSNVLHPLLLARNGHSRPREPQRKGSRKSMRWCAEIMEPKSKGGRDSPVPSQAEADRSGSLEPTRSRPERKSGAQPKLTAAGVRR